MTGTEATAPKRRAFTPNEGRALAPGPVGSQDLEGAELWGGKEGQCSNLGSGVRLYGSLSRGSVCSRGGGWGYLVASVVGQALWGSWQCPEAGVLP